jgi:hypothetical protein
VALVNGISRERPGFLQSWQHSTIARRVEFLERLLSDPAVESSFQRRVAAVKWGLFVGLAAALAWLGYLSWSEAPAQRRPPAEELRPTPRTAARTAPWE